MLHITIGGDYGIAEKLAGIMFGYTLLLKPPVLMSSWAINTKFCNFWSQKQIFHNPYPEVCMQWELNTQKHF